jgi:hypothetical protein
MLKKGFLSVTMVIALFAFVQLSFAEDIKCGASKSDPDAECVASKTVCILAMDPPVCKAPMESGKACKRDKVCASNKCEKPAGSDKGVCK